LAKTPPIPRVHVLEERQRQAGILLAQGKTVREVARRLQVSEKTVWNYRQKPAVQKIIQETQIEFSDMGGGLAMTVIPDAISVLQEILNDPESRAADRIAAAKTLMAGSAAFQERKLLERQINDLERQLAPTMEMETVVDTEIVEVGDDG
jgi:transposase-like protein